MARNRRRGSSSSNSRGTPEKEDDEPQPGCSRTLRLRSSLTVSKSDTSIASTSRAPAVVVNGTQNKIRGRKLSSSDDDLESDIEADSTGDETEDNNSKTEGDEEKASIVEGEEEDEEEESHQVNGENGHAKSPKAQEDVYEIEDVLDYSIEPNRELYQIKWKNWEPEFNTWEPPSNLVNCDEALYNFYRTRKAQVKELLENSEYIVMPNGKRRRKGGRLPNVPPDPRPFEVRVKAFCDATGVRITEKEIEEKYMEWIKTNGKNKGKDGLWPLAKVNDYLEDGQDGKLSKAQIQEFHEELIIAHVIRRHAALKESLKNWQDKINSITQSRPFITVTNQVDLEGPPDGFVFVNDYVPAEGITIPNDPLIGCECDVNCYDQRASCCPGMMDQDFAYTKYKKVKIEVDRPIYECNRKCKCGPDCPNRVVQDGFTDVKLSIFRTDKCGWGVKALKSIKRGTFVTLYVGELITNEEANTRSKADGDGHTYLFDLDFNDFHDPKYSVDAMKVGNVAHFINHSCDPNLGVYSVWVDCLEPDLPKLAMFATRDIARDEELTFDYNNQTDKPRRTENQENSPTKEPRVERRRTRCLCGAKNCRKYIFH